MEPRIQYAKTSDGVNIAYWAMGQGIAFVHMPVLLDSHLALGWRDPPAQEFDRALIASRLVIKYDARGGGLSTRDVEDISLEAHLRDIHGIAKAERSRKVRRKIPMVCPAF